VTCDKLVFSGHAVQRMFERGIRETDVRLIIQTGDVIASYPDDKPFPSSLILGFVRAEPYHVGVAVDPADDTGYVVTVYRPDPEVWHSDFKTRRGA